MERYAKKETIDFAAMMEPVARHFWGEPNSAKSSARELRWGNQGARSIDLGRGTWFDHEDNVGGGVLDLIERETTCDRAGAMRWLSDNDFITNSRSGNTTEEAPRPRIVAQYKYRAEDGELLFEVVRFEPKDFRQRRPDGTWGIKGIRRVLFRLPELIAAVEHGDRIYVPEGERDVLALNAEGLAATTNPMGANKWADEYNEFLRGADVVLLPDNDQPGRDHVADVASRLNGIARSVRILDLAKYWQEGQAPEKGDDVTTWFEAGGSKERLNELAAAASEWQAPPAADDDAKEDEGPGAAPTTQTDTLLAIAAAEAQVFHSPERMGYADVTINDHRETWAIRSRGFKLWLVRKYYEQKRSAPNNAAVGSALSTIEAQALYDGPVREVFVRVAAAEDTIYIDLCDAAWQAIQIDRTGWRVVDKPPVRFSRRAGMLPLALPRGGGSVEDLECFVNVSVKTDFPLVVAFILAALRGKGPFPILVLLGEAGAAKSTLLRLLKALIDPTKAPLRAPPRDNRDLFIAASNSLLLPFDNLSSMPDWLSDTLCRLSTGGGFATRELYTDEEEKLFDSMRPIALNAIENIVIRGDLADRSIFLMLIRIEDSKRTPEAEFWAAFESERAGIFGALLDIMVHGLRELPNVNLDKYPRMADFMQWITACEGASWPAGTFAGAYASNRSKAAADVLEADIVGTAVLAFMKDLHENEDTDEWVGETEPLLKLLAKHVSEETRKGKYWPKAGHRLSGKLTRAAPALAKAGIEIKQGRFEKTNRKKWILKYSP